jgi:type II secretory pathway pseudopilin PulG
VSTIKTISPERAGHADNAVISPFQGFHVSARFDTQGFALGYQITPLRGCRPGNIRVWHALSIQRSAWFNRSGAGHALRQGSGSATRYRAALTLVEIVVSTLIVGVMTVAALNTLGAATRSGMVAGNRAIALGLADELMTEILATGYGDLDSYHDRIEQLTGDRDDWTRRVTVERLQSADLQSTPGSVDQGVKRISVVVKRDGDKLAEQVAIVTDTD